MMKGVDNELRIRGVTSNTYSKGQSIWRKLKACISAPELVVSMPAFPKYADEYAEKGDRRWEERTRSGIKVCISWSF